MEASWLRRPLSQSSSTVVTSPKSSKYPSYVFRYCTTLLAPYTGQYMSRSCGSHPNAPPSKNHRAKDPDTTEPVVSSSSRNVSGDWTKGGNIDSQVFSKKVSTHLFISGQTVELIIRFMSERCSSIRTGSSECSLTTPHRMVWVLDRSVSFHSGPL